MTQKYVLEGVWNGYTPSQRRTVHVEVMHEALRKSVEKLRTIYFTDGTRLDISIREKKPRESIQQLLSYHSLIREAAATGQEVYSVGDR